MIRAVLFFALVLSASLRAAEEMPYKRVEDVVYGRKYGTALTLDVFTPEKQNGAALFWMVSGGWFSAHEAINIANVREFLNRGYTVFAVVHGSQPRYIIPEITQDIHRAIRFVRHNAAKYNVDTNKFGIYGGSAGGHLTLTIATQGGPGNPEAKDHVDRASSQVHAAACFFPPTDFLNYGKEGEDGVGFGILKGYKGAFGPRADGEESRRELGREISPIYYLTTNTAPSLIIHGDADKLVPYQQAEIFIEKAKSLGVPAQLINRPGKEHGWANIIEDLALFADWFDEHLLQKKKNPEP